MKIFPSVALIVLAAALTGCAATGPSHKEIASKIQAVNAEQGRVYFYRNSSMLGAALTPDIKFDGVVVGESKQGGFFYVDTKPGSHEAITSTEVANKLSFVVAKGETKYVRTKVSMGLLAGHVIPELVNADEAMKEVSELSYTGNLAK